LFMVKPLAEATTATKTAALYSILPLLAIMCLLNVDIETT
jgi:hypothetical protein